VASESASLYCGKTISEWVAELIKRRFIQFHAYETVVAASISGSFRWSYLNIGVTSLEPHRHSVSYRPLRGPIRSNIDSICIYLHHAAEGIGREIDE
jgi:hypothetical protein